ncbi:hypothetical protein Hypma_010236 [Hypsizygus marmoreus]|uniref:Uncharacterized protein n=1 Tax=Hypsizygus marmoreus TaxID=39966 RepID=A0A369JQV3_HYPMA|nr:hypothetical protein Hypma_010236 [Hypsizygus marmoreus]
MSGTRLFLSPANQLPICPQGINQFESGPFRPIKRPHIWNTWNQDPTLFSRATLVKLCDPPNGEERLLLRRFSTSFRDTVHHPSNKRRNERAKHGLTCGRRVSSRVWGVGVVIADCHDPKQQYDYPWEWAIAG